MVEDRPSRTERPHGRRGRYRTARRAARRSDGDRQRLEDVSRLSSDWLWETDAGLRLTALSHRVFEVLGYLPFELEGRPLDSLLTFDVPERMAAVIAERRPFRGVACTATARDGQTRNLLIGAAPMFALETGVFQGFRGIAQDVTAERRAEEAVARRDAILKAVGTAAQALLSAPGPDMDLVPLLARLGTAAAAERVQLFALTPREKRGATARRTAIWVAPDMAFEDATAKGREIPLRAFGRGDWERRLARGETVVTPPGRWRRGGDDGRDRPVSVLLAAPVFAADTWWGILLFDRWTTPAPWTEPEIEAVRIAAGLLGGAIARDQSERRLAESRTLLHTAFYANADAIAVIRLRDGIVIDANDRFIAGTGVERSGVLGQPLSTLAPFADPAAARRLSRRLVARGDLRDVDVAVRDRDGNARTVTITARIVRFDGERCALVTARDAGAGRNAVHGTGILPKAIEQSPAPVMVAGADGVIDYLNGRFASLAGYRREELVGQPIDRLTKAASGEGPPRDTWSACWSAVADGCTWHGERPLQCRDGSTVWMRQTLSPVRSEGGTVTHVLCIGEDNVERRGYEERLLRQARHDLLTDLPNRTFFFQQLTRDLADARKHRRTVALVFIDIDRFKFINQTIGPAGGDRVLRELAERLSTWSGSDAMVARIAGNEFALLLRDTADRSRVTAAVPEIQALLAAPVPLDGDEVDVRASIGIACFPEDGADEYALLKNADAAMRGAKESGGNTYRFFRAEMTAKAHAAARYGHDLRRALPERQFAVYYQPVVDLRTDRIVAAEALLRWQHPRFGLVAPANFIGLAEDSGLIEPIGEWVLAEACRQAKAWLDEDLGPERVSVNVSSLQLQRGRLLSSVFTALSGSGLAPAHLGVEITESAVLADIQEAKTTLEKLQTMGVTVSVDDFGTGYASLTYLRRLPLRNLKIDRSFIEDLTTNPDDEAIVDAILAMARRLNLETIAEGVARADQLALLRGKHCELVQGFYFSEPLPAEAFRAYVRARRSAADATGTADPASEARRGR